MTQVILSFGYDTERPYGERADLPGASEFRKRQIEFLHKMTATLDEIVVPRTFFILGEYLERCLEDFSENDLRSIFDVSNNLNDLQQHTYTHPAFRVIKGREDKVPVSAEYFGNDIQRATQVMESVLGFTPTGLRTPIGYDRDLCDRSDILHQLRKAGLSFVSSNLKSENSFCAPLSIGRQPKSYASVGYHDIVEIPSHGWQDVFFTREKANSIGMDLWSADQIVEHYASLLDAAKTFDSVQAFVSLCLHPWAIMEYDPELEIHKRLVDYARSKDALILSYKDASELAMP